MNAGWESDAWWGQTIGRIHGRGGEVTSSVVATSVGFLRRDTKPGAAPTSGCTTFACGVQRMHITSECWVNRRWRKVPARG